MRKRTLLKLLAFFVGLYFVLEYLLPEKVGGDFDCYEVRGAAGLLTAEGVTLWYVGAYREEHTAVGRAMPSYAEPGTWVTLPPHPVLQRSLFVPHDKWGMAEVAAATTSQAMVLFYLGRNPRRESVLCYATSTNNGLSFHHRGVVVFASASNHLTRSSLYAPNGDVPGRIERFAAAYVDGSWHVFLVIAAHGVWYAHGTDLRQLVMAPHPVLSLAELPVGVSAFDVLHSARGWELDFIVETSRCTYVFSPDFTFLTSEWHSAWCSAGSLTTYRHILGTNLVIAGVSAPAPARRAPEASDRATALWLAPRTAFAQGSIVKTPGQPARPTFLSRGTVWAGQFLMIVGSFAVFMAVINLVLFHGKRALQRQSGVVNSVVFFVFLVLMGVCTYFGNRPANQYAAIQLGGDTVLSDSLRTALIARVTTFLNTVSNVSERQVEVGITLCSGASNAVHVEAAEVRVSHVGIISRDMRRQLHDGLWELLVDELGITPDRVNIRIRPHPWATGYDFLFKAFVVPLGISVFSLITFYMVSAAYRAFKVHSTEAALLMVSACIVMLGQLPLGAWLTKPLPAQLEWLTLPWLAQKILTVINAAAYRGVLIGMMVGGFAAGLRIWLGMDESVYSGLDKQ